MVSLLDQSGEGECLSSSPIDSNSILDRLLSCLENLNNRVVELLVFRKFGDLESDFFKVLKVDASVLVGTIGVWILDFLPFLR